MAWLLQCLERTYLQQTLARLNCTPPWITDQPDLWCRTLLDLSAEHSNSVDFFLSSIINDRADKGDCLPSCQSIWYKTINIGFDSRQD